MVLALVALLPPAHPAHAIDVDLKLCEYCRRTWDDSPSRIHAYFDAHGHDKDAYVCSPFCLCEIEKEKPYYKLQSAQIVLWPDRNDMSALMTNAETAHFLTGVKDKHDYSHDPDVAAFRGDKDRAAAKKDLGGTTTTWDKIIEKCKRLAADTDDEEESDYSPLHFRKY